MLETRGRKAPGAARDRRGDGRNPRFVPADPGIENIGTGGLDLARQRYDFLAGGATLDQIDGGYPIDDDEILTHRRARARHQFDGEAMAVCRRAAPSVA